MMMLTRMVWFGIYFTKSLESTPLPKANAALSRFLKERVDRVKYEQDFSAYQSYLERIVTENPTVDHHKIALLDHVTRIHSIYRIPSKKLNRIHNHITDQCLQLSSNEGPESLVVLLGLIYRYNEKKAVAVFRSNKSAIIKHMRSLPIPTLMTLIRFLKDAKIDDAVIRETAIEMLYGQMNFLSEIQLLTLSGYLSLSRKYINKDFLVRLSKRITNLYKSGNLSQKFMFPILSNISEIEVNLHTRSIYVDQLDSLYDVAFPSLFASLNSLDDRSLTQLVSALRRSKLYNQSMLSQLVDTAMKREIVELAEEPPAATKSLSLATFINIVNAMAVFNYSSPQLKRYLLSILKLLSMHKQDLLPAQLFSRLVWSLCVLFERTELRDAYPLIDRSLARAESLPLHEAMNFYLCYLYLRTSYPQINDHRDKIHQWLQAATLETQSSLAQREAFELLKSLGIPCLIEYNLNNLICDIMIPEWQNLRNIVIEFHGFRHFCRNAKKLTGSNILKQKIVTGEQYGYYFIAIDEWLIAQNKKEFLNDFVQGIIAAQASKQSRNSVAPARTSTRVRSRPRIFKVTAETA